MIIIFQGRENEFKDFKRNLQGDLTLDSNQSDYRIIISLIEKIRSDELNSLPSLGFRQVRTESMVDFNLQNLLSIKSLHSEIDTLKNQNKELKEYTNDVSSKIDEYGKSLRAIPLYKNPTIHIIVLIIVLFAIVALIIFLLFKSF